ncbi:hypothetical protein ABL78_3504 [Leptomonas seymouri]|uniref:DUF3456 domain-containing protein n=1 Tax=Leptomonas seymouri TaxID=5684 RepID=A0A0N1PCJ7_LEPSE|nr:hypothetical protein ABL78_3504 [Leptomonas seymouri]|eukprot:KPI87420.1 hypothetical protein ABL78_3504 [Leptomonas seymouri]
MLIFSLVLLSLAVPVVTATQEGHTVRPLHGPGYEHLDCSACLSVSRALFGRLNTTLSENPSSFLSSHRLNSENQLKRLPYRNSELLVAEVMDDFCRSYLNDERSLRLHPKSKVRLYHQQVWKDSTLGVRPSLREDELYPEGEHNPDWDVYVELRRYPIATAYSPKDQEALHGMEMLAATPTMCAMLVEDFEEEIESLVKLAHNLSDIDYGLCGLPLAKAAGISAAAEVEKVRAAIQPITNICARTEVLREAAHRDQLRWSQYMRREARRKAKLAEEMALKKDTEESDKTGHENQADVSSDYGESPGDKASASSADLVNAQATNSHSDPAASAEGVEGAAAGSMAQGEVDGGDL